MQPIAVRRHRILSPIAMGFCAVITTTVAVVAFRKFYRPWKMRSKYAASESFADEYFEKHDEVSLEHERF